MGGFIAPFIIESLLWLTVKAHKRVSDQYVTNIIILLPLVLESSCCKQKISRFCKGICNILPEGIRNCLFLEGSKVYKEASCIRSLKDQNAVASLNVRSCWDHGSLVSKQNSTNDCNLKMALKCQGIFSKSLMTHGSYTSLVVRQKTVRLSDRSEGTQHKINFVKNFPQWGLNTQPPDHQSNALLTMLRRNLLKITEVNSLLFNAPLHLLGLCLFLESIEHDFIRALIIHTDNQIVT